MNMISFGAILAIAILATSAFANEPQKFETETNATKFCKAGHVVWFNPDSKIYFPPSSQHYGKTASGGYTCETLAKKEGFKPSKGH